ncbi:hypothetical protein Tco_0296480 [Tanacetum coccineum]
MLSSQIRRRSAGFRPSSPEAEANTTTPPPLSSPHPRNHLNIISIMAAAPPPSTPTAAAYTYITTTTTTASPHHRVHIIIIFTTKGALVFSATTMGAWGFIKHQKGCVGFDKDTTRLAERNNVKKRSYEESVRTNLNEEPPLLELRLLRQLKAFGELHHQTCRNLCRMDTLSLVSKYLKDLEECMDDGDSKVAKEAKLFDALEHKIDRQGAWDAELDLTDSTNYVTEEVLGNMGFVRVNFCDYGRKMVNDVNVEIHGVKFKADFVVLDYVNEGEPSIMFGRDFLVTTKSHVDFGLGEIRMNHTMFKEGIEVIDLTEEVRSSSEEVVKIGKLTERNEVKKRSYEVSANSIFDLKTPVEQ